MSFKAEVDALAAYYQAKLAERYERERIEAGTAKTAQTGLVHESRVRQHLAQNPHPSKDEESI